MIMNWVGQKFCFGFSYDVAENLNELIGQPKILPLSINPPSVTCETVNWVNSKYPIYTINGLANIYKPCEI